MTFDQITVLILTYNERENIGRVLDRLTWAHRVVVLDSGSDDGTVEIAGSFENVRVISRTFDNHAAQWNYGLGSAEIIGEWVLALDADYLIADGFSEEVAALEPGPSDGGYIAEFNYAIFGRLLHGSMYPRGTVLYRRARAHYVQDGHTQRVVVDGTLHPLRSKIVHDDRKPLSRWLVSQDRYAELEVANIVSVSIRSLGWPDKLRRMIIIMPWLAPFYCLFLRMGLLDGWAGLYYALQRGMAESILALKLVHRYLENASSTSDMKRKSTK
jgi:glycosyltransferase involved in cell wall biosynthesis